MASFFGFFGSGSQQLWDSAKFSLIKSNSITITQIEIDRGSYGIIYKAIYGGKECVAKEIHHALIEGGIKSNTAVQSFIKEVNILSTLRHPSIVHFLGIHFREKSRVPILIMEKMWMSLDSLLAERPSISLVIKINILKDVACGLKYLHSHEPQILHRDLTTGNILLNKNLDAKLADLGLAKALESITKHLTSAPGTAAFMPPEALQHNPVYSTKLDIFSFGCVLVHTVTQEYPYPTDGHEASTAGKGKFVKVSEYTRREKYIKILEEGCPHLTYLASSCLKDDPAHRPDAERVLSWIEDYWKKPETKKNRSESLMHNCKLDKFSLMLSLDNQSTRAEELESTLKLYQSQVQELTNSAVAKDEQITSLQRSNNDQQASIQSQQSEIDQLKFQCDKLQQDMSLQSDSEIVMSLNSILRQEQEDMREKQEEIKSLKMKLSNMESSFTSLRKESLEKERNLLEEGSQLKVCLKKEAELIQNIEVLNNEKQSLIHEKEELHIQVNNHIANLENRQKEVEELKAKLAKAELNSCSSSERTIVDKQLTYKKTMDQSSDNELNKNPTNEKIVHYKYREQNEQMQNASVDMRKILKENEELRIKVMEEEKKHQKLKEESEQNVKKKLDYWKAKAESADMDLARRLEAEKQKLDQEKERIKQQVLEVNKLNDNYLTEFNKNVMEEQAMDESYALRKKQMDGWLLTLEKQKKEISELTARLSNAKSVSRQQLDEKSLRISLLQTQLNACQEKLDGKDKQLNDLQSQNENLQNLLENMSKLHTAAQKELDN